MKCEIQLWNVYKAIKETIFIVAVKYQQGFLEQLRPNGLNYKEEQQQRSLSIKLHCSKPNISWDRLDCRVYFVTYMVGKHEEHHC
jgi:hypothetical protein